MQFAMSTLISNIKFQNKQMRFPNFGQGFESHIFHGENMKCFKPTLQKTWTYLSIHLEMKQVYIII